MACNHNIHHQLAYTRNGANSYVKDGLLHIRAIPSGTGYTSARMVTKNKGKRVRHLILGLCCIPPGTHRSNIFATHPFVCCACWLQLARRFCHPEPVCAPSGDWKYGMVRVRAALPTAEGLWPAIWMLPTQSPLGWPKGPLVFRAPCSFPAMLACSNALNSAGVHHGSHFELPCGKIMI